MSGKEFGYVGDQGCTQYPGLLLFVYLRSPFRSLDRDEAVLITIPSNTLRIIRVMTHRFFREVLMR
jgi:hypothetical protein